MEYITGIQYPKTELENIAEWWQNHREYDVNVEKDYIEIVRRDDELIIEDFRNRRERECFPYINRGSLWYDTLTNEQKLELQVWYAAWLNVTQTLVVPQKPTWLI